jgi:G3E family GTPase
MAAAGAKAQSHAVPNGTASHPEHAAAGAVAAQASHHHHHHHHHHHADTNAKAPTSKKPAAKKPADPSETSKLLAAKISQLESDRAGEKDLEAEIGKWW